MMEFYLLFLLCLSTGDSARILGLSLFPGRSHWIVIEPLYKELAARGHQVTVYSTFPQSKPLPNYTDVDFSSKMPPMISAFSIDTIKNKMPNPWATISFMDELTSQVCQLVNEPELQKLLKSEDEYDVVITQLFGNDCYAYFAYKLKIPLIVYTTSMAMPWAAERMGLPDNPAYIPNYLVDFSPDMSFYQRLYNFMILAYSKTLHNVFSWMAQTEMEQMFGGSLPRLTEVVANTSLMFLNSYHALNQPRPYPPNVVEIGGIHIKEEKSLPKDLQVIFDNATNGVIVMSFGSLVRSSTIPKSTIKKFLNAFAKIPQTIIFKYEEDLPEAPPNVFTRKWLPQRDCIAHKNVLAIIAHGGLSSTIEAVYIGKPLIGIPFYADQSVNVKSIVRRGAGVRLDIDTISEEKISFAISEILNNPKYSENMLRLSRQFRDRPMSALDTAVYWTEYVIRHQGAPTLQPASVHLPLYQLMMLDVLAVIVTTIAVSLFSVYYFIRCIVTAVRKNQKRIKSVKKTE